MAQQKKATLRYLVLKNELFENKTKKEQLLDYIAQKHWVKTHEIIKWGLENYHVRAERTARELAQGNKIYRMPSQEKILRFGNIKEDIWVYNGFV